MRFWAGIDVGKAFHWVCVLDGEGEVVLSRRVEATGRHREVCLEEIVGLGGDRTFGIDLLGGGERVFYLPGTTINRARDGYPGSPRATAGTPA